MGMHLFDYHLLEYMHLRTIQKIKNPQNPKINPHDPAISLTLSAILSPLVILASSCLSTSMLIG